MTTIHNSNGDVIHVSRSLRGILEHSRTHVVETVSLTSETAHLQIKFSNGDWTGVFFSDFSVLKQWVNSRRNFRGATLIIDEENKGIL